MKTNATKTALLLLSLTLLFASCARMPRYRDELAAGSMMEEVLEVMQDNKDYTHADGTHFAKYFALPATVREVDVRYSTDAGSIDEVGILHVTDNTAPQTAELIESYLSQSYEENHTFYDSYIPSQTPKLRDAEVKVFGNYVVYAILDAPARKAVFDNVKAQLTE
jgi:hypothetical protein